MKQFVAVVGTTEVDWLKISILIFKTHMGFRLTFVISEVIFLFYN